MRRGCSARMGRGRATAARKLTALCCRQRGTPILYACVCVSPYLQRVLILAARAHTCSACSYLQRVLLLAAILAARAHTCSYTCSACSHLQLYLQRVLILARVQVPVSARLAHVQHGADPLLVWDQPGPQPKRVAQIPQHTMATIRACAAVRIVQRGLSTKRMLCGGILMSHTIHQ